MTQEELIKVFKYIVKKCDMLINNNNYKADDYTQDTVEDIAELCNHILDGDYGKLVEVKEVNPTDVFVEKAKNMTQEDKDYLFWRCKMNWHKKYYRYINEWIDNVLPIQLEYFRREMNNLIKRGVYDTRK